MKLLPIIAAMFILTSCGKEYIENDLEAPEYVLNAAAYEEECNGYYSLDNPKRFNSVLKMDVKPDSTDRTFLLGLATKIWIDIEENTVLVYNPYTPEDVQTIELENSSEISLQITAKSGKVILEVEEKSLDLGLTEIPENVGFCRNDGKFVHSVEIFDVLE